MIKTEMDRRTKQCSLPTDWENRFGEERWEETEEGARPVAPMSTGGGENQVNRDLSLPVREG